MSRPPGPSSVLISQIDHLSRLLESLPCTLPLDPPDSTYNFGLDTELVAEEGHWHAFNRNLEVCFETYKLRDGASIVFKERGSRYKALIQMFKITMKALTKDSEQDFLREVWLEQLISAAQLQGARIPARGTKCDTVHNDSESQPEKRQQLTFQSALPPRANLEAQVTRVVPVHHQVTVSISTNLGANPSSRTALAAGSASRQATLADFAWKPLRTEEEKAEQWKRLAKYSERDREIARVEEEVEKAERKEHVKELARERQRHRHAMLKELNPEPK
ncbi:hypothetical protein BU15DRAFT_84081 [Melanogaster broomeanus]|nr:hypothetical protein BU15DRAFT_84081 [Melanogaster broomeanus]